VEKPQVQEKKGGSPLLKWGCIGCGCLAILLVIAAILIALVLPSFKKEVGVKKEEVKKEVTVKEEKPQEEVTEEKVEKKVPEGFLTYTDATYKIKLVYPKEWEKKVGELGTIVAFLSPPESASDTFRENVNIAIEDISSRPMTLDEYTNLSLSQLDQFVQNANVLESGEDTLGGIRAHRLVYTGEMESNGKIYTLKWLQVYTIKNNKVYMFTYTSAEDSYSDYLDSVEQMIDSFEIME
jgi:serine/threonine-protein kinase